MLLRADQITNPGLAAHLQINNRPRDEVSDGGANGVPVLEREKECTNLFAEEIYLRNEYALVLSLR